MASTLAPSSSSMSQERNVDLASPRVQAAMQVLGVSRADVTPHSRNMFEEGQGGDVRYDLLERRRRRIVTEVLSLAATGAEGSIMERTGSPQQSTGLMMDDVLRNEQANIETLRRMGKKESENFAIHELEQQLVQYNSMKKQEESQQRIRDLMKERESRLAEMRKLAEKRAEKSQQVRERAERSLQDRADEITASLTQGMERAQKVLDDRQHSWDSTRQRNAERRRRALDAKESHETHHLRRREDNWRQLQDKDKDLQERLYRAAAEQQAVSDAFAEKLAGCVERAKDHLQQKQEERQENYMASLDRHQKAANERDIQLQERVKKFADKNKDERRKYEARAEKYQQDQERAFEKAASSPDIRSHRLSAEALAFFENRKLMRDLADMNQAQLARAHEYNQDTALLKIENTRARVQDIVDKRTAAAKRRMVMVKNVAMEKFHLSQRFERLKDCGPTKMSNMLADMDPEPSSVEKINELLTAMNMDLLPGTHKENDEGDK